MQKNMPEKIPLIGVRKGDGSIAYEPLYTDEQIILRPDPEDLLSLEEKKRRKDLSLTTPKINNDGTNPIVVGYENGVPKVLPVNRGTSDSGRVRPKPPSE